MNARLIKSLRAAGFMGVLSLVLISCVAALHLATAEQVERNADLFQQRAVLEAAGVSLPATPAAVAELYLQTVTAEPADAPERFYVHDAPHGDVRAIVFKRHGRGLWGVIDAVVAYRPATHDFGEIRFLDHNETPGLGARIEEPWFQRQIAGKTGPFVLRPEGTGSDAPTEIDAITGATITSTAVRDLLNAVARDAAQTKEAVVP